MTTTHTNDPVTGHNARATVTETSHKARVDTGLVVGLSVGFGVLMLLVWALLKFHQQRTARAIAHINPDGAAAERAVQAERAHARKGLIPRAWRWLRQVLRDGDPPQNGKLAWPARPDETAPLRPNLPLSGGFALIFFSHRSSSLFSHLRLDGGFALRFFLDSTTDRQT
ncbi:hypothetical protein N7488_011860 [Penicillium malachiteum]|nr:hypothetical protein N7488_011860 [Penicillium malachiteum]